MNTHTLRGIIKDSTWTHVSLGRVLLSSDFLFPGLLLFLRFEEGMELLHREEGCSHAQVARLRGTGTESPSPDDRQCLQDMASWLVKGNLVQF